MRYRRPQANGTLSHVSRSRNEFDLSGYLGEISVYDLAKTPLDRGKGGERGQIYFVGIEFTQKAKKAKWSVSRESINRGNR